MAITMALRYPSRLGYVGVASQISVAMVIATLPTTPSARFSH